MKLAPIDRFNKYTQLNVETGCIEWIGYRGVDGEYSRNSLASRIRCPFLKKDIYLATRTPVTPEHIAELVEIYKKARAEIDQFGKVISWGKGKKKSQSEDPPSGN